MKNKTGVFLEVQGSFGRSDGRAYRSPFCDETGAGIAERFPVAVRFFANHVQPLVGQIVA
jgi:hypothetical protein